MTATANIWGGNCVSVCSLNVRGIADEKKRKDIFMWLKNKNCNIYCLQDIHCGPQNQDIFKTDWGSDAYFSCKTSNARGVAILFNNNFDFAVTGQTGDEDGNILGLNIQIENQEFALMTLYGPNQDDPVFYHTTVRKIIQQLNADNVIICGDFNLVQDQSLDTHGYLHENNIRASREMHILKDLYNLTDPWRQLFPHDREFTWRNSSNSKMSRLDFFLMSDHMMSNIDQSVISFGYRTDHSLVSINLKTASTKRGRGFWKFNVSLLKNEKYVNNVKQIVREIATEYNVLEIENNTHANTNIDNTLFWEVLKMKIREMSIKFSSELKRKLQRDQKYLETSINLLEKGLHNCRPEVNQLYLNYKANLENIRENYLQGVLIRSKSNWLEHGEKPSKYFCNLEKKNYVNKSINKVISDNGSIILEPKKILDELLLFYKTLYSSKSESTDSNVERMHMFINEHCACKLNNTTKLSLDQEITLDEIKLAIKSMKNCKTPGSDGFPIEFYKFFWQDIGIYLFKSFQNTFITEQLSINQKRGIITCIPKGDKTRTLLKNWRPITLLNTDYKIISNVLANRLKTCLPSIIHPDQKGFIKDRCIAENTRLVYDIMDNLKNSKQYGLLFLIDFEKAFDSIEWKFIELTLQAGNFGNNFVKWFKILYYNSESCVINNGNYSEFFHLGRGCRQGDPISPYLFIIAAEILSNSIRSSESIKGISIGNTEFKIGQYADDTFLFLDGSKKSLDSAISCLRKFREYSGLKINMDKCEAFWMGTKVGSLDRLQSNIRFVTEFKLLGIRFPQNMQHFNSVNIDSKITEIEKLLLAYKRRHLSLFGRVTVIKSMAVSKLINVLSVINTPTRETINKIEKMFQEFVWDGKRLRTQYNFGTKPLSEGGISLPNLKMLNSSLKIAWIKRSFDDTGSWQKLFREIFDEPKLIWNLDPKSIKVLSNFHKNVFWKCVLLEWSNFLQDNAPEDINIIRKYVIWNSYYLNTPNILIQKANLIQKGFINIADLYMGNQICSRAQFCEKFNININFLDFESLKRSIPKTWNNLIAAHVDWMPENVYNSTDKLLKTKKACRFIYSCLVGHCLPRRIIHENKWELILGCTLDTKCWESSYVLINQITMDTKLRSFQYKILHRLIVTNKNLKLWNIKNDDKCTFCEIQVETLEHLLSDCVYSKSLWFDLAEWLLPEINMYSLVNTKNIIMGVSNGQDWTSIVNLLFLLTKRYIYVQRCLKQRLVFRSLLDYFLVYRKIELNISDCDLQKRYVQNWSIVDHKF